MNRFLFIVAFFGIPVLHAQQNAYEFINLGEYAVGYIDTTIYNPNQNYEGFGYGGEAPIFLKIWYPLTSPPKTTTMNYGDFQGRIPASPVDEVYRNLIDVGDPLRISYHISESLPDYDLIDYGNFSYEQVLDTIRTLPSISHYAPIKETLNFPVIIYHHGSQGFADENHIMAEYFASKGYIFISANYHLPYSNLTYGLTTLPFDNLSFPKAVIVFAKSITSNPDLYYIGHSWGAQIGWKYLYERGWANAFISLETTIEFKGDDIDIYEFWPDLYKLIREEKTAYHIPILVLANTMTNEPFSFFEVAGTASLIHGSSIESFEHESYTSAYWLRYFFRDKIQQPDIEMMRNQIELYAKHLELIHSFLESVENNDPMETGQFRKDFYLNIIR